MSSTSTQQAPTSRPLSASHMADKKSGKSRIGPYLLTKTLGMGSTGRVKLGIHQKTNQRVAVKIISKQQMQSADAKEQQLGRKIEREIVIMKLIQHPNVLSLLDVYETDDELFLVLEHVEGGELFDYLVKKGHLDEREACTFFQQIIFGLDYCHKHQICHRDLKPENLLLDPRRRIKIADFGMASLQQSGKMLETSCGSPHYASPEIIKGIKYDGAISDIWSCGVILYALLSGNLPFDDDNIRRLLSKVKLGKFNMPSHISPSAQDLISRMLQVEPSDRIQIEQIVAHPWFNTISPQMELRKPVSEVLRKNKPVNAENNLPLDDDILKSLNLLGWTDEDNLRTTLLSNSPHPQKVFYHLLFQRKLDYLSTYCEEEENEEEGLPRRRAESMAALYGAGGKNKSESNLLMAKGRVGSQAILSAGAERAGSSKDVMSGLASTQPRGKGPAFPPAALASPGGGFRAIANAAVTGAGFRGRVQSSVEPSDKKKSKDLAIRIPDRMLPMRATSEHIRSAGSLHGSGTISEADVASYRKRPELVKTDSQGSTPILVTPKRSWFANLFHFKPEAILMGSDQNAADTIVTLRQALAAAGVKVQEGRRDGLKCKAEVAETDVESGAIVHKPIKFRIDLQETSQTSSHFGLHASSSHLPSPTSPGFPSSAGALGCHLQFSLQQGPMDGMTRIVESLVSLHLTRKD